MQLQKDNECKQVLSYFNPELYLTLDNKHSKLGEFSLSLFDRHNIITLDLSQYSSIDDLRKVVYLNRYNRKYLLTNLNESSVTLDQINEQINEISYLLDLNNQHVELNKNYTEVKYQQEGKTIKLDLNELEKSVQILEGHITKRNKWGLVIGFPSLGKTEVSKYLATKLNYKLIEWENLSN